MPLAFLALMAAVAAADVPAKPAAAATTEVSPLIVRPPPPGAPKADATVTVSAETGASQSVAIWPASAREAGIGGYVTLNCLIDVHGLAETCRVVFETPPGHGFGGAALALRPTFKLTPRAGPDGPEDARMNVAVDFSIKESRSNVRDVMSHNAGPGGMAPETGGGGDAGSGLHDINAHGLVVYDNPGAMRRITMMDSRVWAQAPGFDELAAAYPAQGGGVEGYAVAHCRVEATGALDGCKAVKELPAGHGFGKAAVALAPRFRVSPQAMAAAPRGAPIEVDVPVRFPTPAEARDHIVRAPVWVAGSDPQTLLAEFPRAVAKKGSPGALVKCEVGADGALTGCGIELTSPDGIDFDEAAVKFASRLKMSLWSAEAGPVTGGVVHVPVKLEQ